MGEASPPTEHFPSIRPPHLPSPQDPCHPPCPAKPLVSVGGCLSRSWQTWDREGARSWVVGVLREGYQLQFTDQKPPLSPSPCNQSGYKDPQKNLLIQEEVESLLKKQAIEIVHQPSTGYYSRVFLREKKNGGWRPILDLKSMNPFLACPSFKQETIKTIREGLLPDGWTYSLDLQDAFFQVPVHKASRKFLRFLFQGVCYQYKVLPFGLKPSPYVFTRVMSEVKSMIQTMGHQLFMYLDDWLGQCQNQQLALHHASELVDLSNKLGLLINAEKSDLTPSQTFEFVGMLVDLVKFQVCCTTKNSLAIQDAVLLFLTRSQWPALKWLSLIGLLQSQCAFTRGGYLHLRPLQFHVSRQWIMSRQPLTTFIRVSGTVKEVLRWWTNPEHLQEGVPVRPPEFTLRTFTDASTAGWGGHVLNSKYAGTWSVAEKKLHINVLEMRAVRLVLLQHNPPPKSVILATTDNATVVAYINHQGGTRSWEMWLETKLLLQLSLSKDWILKSRHIAGNLNVLADRLSRSGQILSTEWELHPEAALLLFHRWGSPLTDLFATKENTKCLTFVSPYPEETAWATDAFSISWEGLSAYAYPPTKIIPRVLSKIQQTLDLRIILIAPYWVRQSWFPRLQELAAEPPLPLPHWRKLLKQPGGNLYHDSPEWLNLHGWLLLRQSTEVGDSVRRQLSA